MSTNAAHNIAKEPVDTKDTILETGASIIQDFEPVNNICAHLNAYHVYADDPSRAVEAQHYCTHISKDIRQCIIYDSPEKSARLIGVEYTSSDRRTRRPCNRIHRALALAHAKRMGSLACCA